jgi:hypothetical protein
MNTKYELILFLFIYFSCSHGLAKKQYLITKNGTIYTAVQNLIEYPDPEVVALVIYENNINKTGYKLNPLKKFFSKLLLKHKMTQILQLG